jgi:hypothetical protein
MVSIELIYEAWNVQIFEDYELLIIDFEKTLKAHLRSYQQQGNKST